MIMRTFIFFLFLSAMLSSHPVTALEPERREVVVVHARVWNGQGYEEVYVPSDKVDIQLLSGAASALAFVRTLEYYWPLSRRSYVDFEKQRETIEGTLLITRDGEKVAEIRPQSYSILYPEGARNGDASLIWGAEAEAARTEHLEAQRDFRRRFVEAQRAHRDYERRLVKSGADRKPGETAEAIPPPPPIPEPSMRLVTEPRVGYRVDLRAGTYRMELRADGRTVPGTSKTLRVVQAEGRAGLVADVVPEERWTRPLAANTEEMRIFARPGTTFYLTLANAERFEEDEYKPVVSPQAKVVPGREMWVRRSQADEDALSLVWADGDTSALERKGFKVDQTRGTGFGYVVRTAAEGESPDLRAFAVEVPDEPSLQRGTLSRPEQPDFRRDIVAVHPRNEMLGLILAFAPVAVFALWRFGRGWSAHRKR
ncbi:hypothetical protein [Amorphus orientalis]|uniref:Uncharacterized protein n=1 Tax=Amorphus orientalis TaxID=649198 RepID=A0AAE4AT83_9HYPH|nr:hypothetical protein [Amorphus orientalis]MDQ0315897.1 hypothetical protein [Amorphus orientalis]